MLLPFALVSVAAQGPGVDYVPATPPMRLADPVPYFAPTSWIWPGASGLMARVVRDFDNDGAQDVLFTFGIYATPPELRTWRGDGEGGFTAGSVSPLLGYPVYLQAGVAPFGVADFDLDGSLDIVISSLAGAEMMRGDGLGGFSPWSATPIIGPPGYWAAGDINGDGAPELIVTQYSCGGAPGMSSALNTGTGSFTPGTCSTFYWDTGTCPIQTELRDLDGDSFADYVGCGSVFQILRGFGNGCFAFFQPLIYWYTVGPSATEKFYAWGDFNGDGVDDLVLVTPVSGTVVNPIHVAVYFRAAPLAPTWNLGPTFFNPGWPTGVAAADLDQDGYCDFVVTEVGSPVNYSSTGNVARVYRNLGGGTAFEITPRSEGYTWWVTSPVLTDVNADGYPDLFVNQRGQVAATSPSFAVAINTTGGGDIEVIGRPQIGRTVRLDLEGKALASWLLLASPGTGPPISLPGFQGALQLDPANLILMGSGVFPPDGNLLVPVSIPNNPVLVGGVLNLQFVASLPSASPPGWFSGTRSVTIR